MERRIDFWIIGAQKSGTTALFEYLGEHPDIFVPVTKEVHFFIRDELYEQGNRYFGPLFGDAPDQVILGAADVDLMFCSHHAHRVHAYNPEIQLLAVLRNPVDRAYSGYWFARRLGFEDAETFEEALSREEERKKGSYFEQMKLTYLSRGYYAEQLSQFLAVFDRDQLRVILTEDLRRDPEATLESTLQWLGLPPALDSIDYERRVNVAGVPRSMLLQKVLRSDESFLKGLLRSVLPHRARLFIRRHVINPMLAWNVEESSYPPMSDETRAKLEDHFAPHNEALADIIDRELDHWQ